MPSPARSPEPARHLALARPFGAPWTERRQALAGAVWLVLLCAAVGTSFALWDALREIRVQGFEAEHFTRSIRALLVRAADRGALEGGLTAVLFLAGAWLAGAFTELGAILDAGRVLETLADRARVLRAQATIALAFLAAAVALELRGGGLSRAQVALLGGLGAGAILCLAAIARVARSRGARREGAAQVEGRARAWAHAAVCACAVLFPLAYPVASERLWRPFAAESIAAGLCLLAGAAGTFALARRALLGSGGAGLALRAAMVVLVLPALAPLAVRALLRDGTTLAARERCNVLVIGIDTLRADSVDLVEPASGARDRTPNLRGLGRRGVRFTQAISQSSWTMPAFASVLTGKYPLEHGAVSLTGRLRDREFTLAEILREAGWRTGSAVANDYTDRRHGFAQGCEWFRDDCVRDAGEESSTALTDEAIAFVQARDERPWFLFAHYMDPHYQYLDHAEWTWADGYTGWWKEQNDLDNLVRNRHLVGPEDLRWLRDLHDEEVAHTDREIGRLLAALERSGDAARTLIVVVADHGEEFLEHGNFSHTTTLYEELVRVPLFVVPPGASPGGGSARDDVVETRRVFSTVLDAVGLAFAAETRPRGLLAAPAPGTAPATATETEEARAFSMVWLPDAQLRWGKRFQVASLRTPRWKLIRNLTRDTWELYDLAADPGERSARYVGGDGPPEETKDAAELRQALEDWIRAQQVHAASVPRDQLGDRGLDRLRALGYF